MVDDYKKMLERAYSKMPAVVFEKKRFEVPHIKITNEGKKAIWANAQEIANYVNRDLHHMAKYISKDLGVSFRIEDTRIIFIGRIGTLTIQKKFDKYIEVCVICPVCKKPDTKLEKTDRIKIMKCLACGASSPLPQ
ncbi:MAG: translation initiation factor IF-2 subunit beta [Candidatus Altiarchaeota archaeon]|nr:translation initiation factor IF-2 subunit beta [Candidatus Altiarchaeota archaeon]